MATTHYIDDNLGLLKNTYEISVCSTSLCGRSYCNIYLIPSDGFSSVIVHDIIFTVDSDSYYVLNSTRFISNGFNILNNSKHL